MAQRISWIQPGTSDIAQIEVSKSSTIFGTYVVSTTMDATDDGGTKSSSNSWVTSYLDTGGTRTNWYKVRFYDDTNSIWSDYSDPTTSEELLRLCTVTEIKRAMNTVGRWTDDEVFNTITDVDDLIYIEMGMPLKAIYSVTGQIDSTLQDSYYVGEEDIYRVDRVFYGTTRMTEYYLDDGYKVNLRYGMVRLLPVASGGPTLAQENDIEIQYVPKVYNQISIYRTCKRLLEQLDFTSGGAVSKELGAIEKRLESVETLLSHKIGVQLSSDVKWYGKYYGTNRRYLEQDSIRNRYISSTGW